MDRSLILALGSGLPQARALPCGCGQQAMHALAGARNVAVDQAPVSGLGSFSGEPDLVMVLPGLEAELPRSVLKLRRRWERTPILGCFCSNVVTSAGVLRSLSQGIDDYVNCPVRPIDLVPRVERLLSRREALRFRCQGRRGDVSLKSLVGESESFLRVLEMVPRLGSADATLLITGETGTGKEFFARAIHYAGPRRSKPFVPVNCGALPDHLVENELFGHTKGAYTGASGSVAGLVAESEGGTLFLDEIEALSVVSQAKLLRFLQDHEYRPLGSTKTRRADVRIVAATNVDLRREVDRRRYREDLFYRLSILLLHIPPLRDRPGDVPLLARHFLRKYARHRGGEGHRLAPEAIDALAAHHWPGNVRELEAVMQRALLTATGKRIGMEELEITGGGRQHIGSGLHRFRDAKRETLSRFEQSYLMRVLTAHRGNVSEAARAAGTDRRALQRLMRKHGIDRQAFVD